MNLVFVHDHIFRKYNNKYYSTGGLTANVLSRYTEIFGNITILSRQIEIKKLEGNLTEATKEGVDFVCVPNYKSLSKVYLFFKAKNIIKKHVKNADYLILRTSSFANIAAKYAKKYKKPYLVEVVGCAWDAVWNYNLIGKILAPISYLIQKKTVKHASHAIYVTNSFLQKRYPTKGKTANISDVLHLPKDESILKKRLDKIKKMTNDKKLIIGTIGAVDVKYKGQERIIKAISILNKNGYDFEYQIVGGGSTMYLQKIAKKYDIIDKVIFLGTKKHSDVFEWFQIIDIYSQPSRQEGLPRALIEAMSYGVPCIGAKTGGIPELLEKECIFSNGINSNYEIIKLLSSFTKEKLILQAKRNFNEALNYLPDKLEQRRSDFLNDYKTMIDNG